MPLHGGHPPFTQLTLDGVPALEGGVEAGDGIWSVQAPKMRREHADCEQSVLERPTFFQPPACKTAPAAARLTTQPASGTFTTPASLTLLRKNCTRMWSGGAANHSRA